MKAGGLRDAGVPEAPGFRPPRSPAAHPAASAHPAAASPAVSSGVSKFRAYQRQQVQHAGVDEAAASLRGALPGAALRKQPPAHSPSLDRWLDSLPGSQNGSPRARRDAVAGSTSAVEQSPQSPSGRPAPDEAALAQLAAVRAEQQVQQAEAAAQVQTLLEAARRHEASIAVRDEELAKLRGENCAVAPV